MLLKTAARSTPALNASRFRFRAIFLQSAEAAATKNNSNSDAYENRTKSAQSEGFETNGRRERISGPKGLNAVRRFLREACGYWRFQHAKTRQRKLAAVRLAEGEELETNTLCFFQTFSMR